MKKIIGFVVVTLMLVGCGESKTDGAKVLENLANEFPDLATTAANGTQDPDDGSIACPKGGKFFPIQTDGTATSNTFQFTFSACVLTDGSTLNSDCNLSQVVCPIGWTQTIDGAGTTNEIVNDSPYQLTFTNDGTSSTINTDTRGVQINGSNITGFAIIDNSNIQF